MSRQIPKNLRFLCENWNDKDISGVCLEGSSGSRKTFSIIDFIIYTSTFEPVRVNIVKETYNSFKTTLYGDFAKRLEELQIKNPFSYVKDISTWNFCGSKINFLGADSPDKFTGRCDILWGNELLDIPKEVWRQARQRCERFWIGDWNPKTTDHYVFDFEKRTDVKFLRTTFRDNPFIPEISRNEILAYEPTPQNIEHGTADEYMWKVYGLGERAARSGLVHPNVTWVNDFPTDCEKIGYGCDFGWTNSPTAIVRAGNKGNDLFVELLYYKPTPRAAELIEAVKLFVPEDGHITCDSSDSNAKNEGVSYIMEMRRAGINALPARKFPGSVKVGIELINKHNLFYVRNVDLRKEQENRVWRYVGGIPLNEPEKGNDHAHDALAYCLQTDFRN